MGELSPWHLLILALVFVVLFGSKKLPDAARSVGRSMRIFKAETRGLREDDHDATPAPAPAAPQLAAPAPQPAVTQPVQQPVAQAYPTAPPVAAPVAPPTVQQPVAQPPQVAQPAPGYVEGQPVGAPEQHA